MPITITAVGTVPSTPVDATSPDGHIRAVVDPQYGGVKIHVDYTLSDPALDQPLAFPFVCIVHRRDPDGTAHRVRGGDTYMNYAGAGWLYDQEAPLSAEVTYWLTPIYADGTNGPASAGVTVLTDTPTPGMWLVPPNYPEYAVNAMAMDGRTGAYAGRADLQTVIGTEYPAVVLDSRASLATTMTVLTQGQTQFIAMKNLIAQNLILRKSTSWEREDAWFVIRDVAYQPISAAMNAGGPLGPGFQWTLGLTRVRRPATKGQLVSFPGHSISDRLAAYPLLGDFPARLINGNLLSDNDSTFEAAIAWNATNANTVVSQDTTESREGSASLLMTSVAAGDVAAKSPTSFGVTPGQAIELTAWVLSQSGARSVLLEIDFLDAAGGPVSFPQSPAVLVQPLLWTFLKYTQVVPAGAAQIRCVVQGTAQAAAELFNVDVVFLGPLP